MTKAIAAINTGNDTACNIGGCCGYLFVKASNTQFTFEAGIKLGLVNIITVHTVYHYWSREVMMIFSRFLPPYPSGAYSFAGSISYFAGMLIYLSFLLVYGCISETFTEEYA